MFLLSITMLEKFIIDLKNNQNKCKSIEGVFLGESFVQIVNSSYKKIVIKNTEHSISDVVIDCINENVHAITFYGKLDISPFGLVQKFRKYREDYSFRDELYFYFFNEDSIGGDFSLSFFKTDNSTIDFDVTNLDNLTIYFKNK